MNQFIKALFFLVVFLSSLRPVLAKDDLPSLPKGPLILTSVRPEQLSANYWIHRLPEPDRALKTPEELRILNEDIHREISQVVDVFSMESRRAGGPIREQIELEYGALKGRVLYGVDGRRIPKMVFEQDIKPLIQTEKIPGSIAMKWGVATRPTSVRALPSDIKMLEAVGDVEFDQLQFTLIKLWTPVSIYHVSNNNEWLYIQAPYVRGWVKAKDIAFFSNRAELKKYVKSNPFLVVAGESTLLFSDPSLQTILQRPSMGTLLPLMGKIADAYIVWLPRRGANGAASMYRGFIHSRSDVSEGFPSFTQRHIIQQAFKLLSARYGWGGTYNGRDCSGFTQDVFLSLGVEMPRGSKEQVFVGTQINHFEYKEDKEAKIAALQSVTPGITLLRMPHHQMIYLGEENGQFYAIHSTWAERISMTSDKKRRINQVVVSDLSLNGNSYLGSLFDRIISVNEID